MPLSTRSRTTLTTILILLLLALGLRLPLLNGSFWLDEAAQALESIRPLSQQLDIAHDFQPPLLHLIVHAAAYASHAEWWLRLWGAVIPGLATIWVMWKINLLRFSTKSGLLSVILLATSSFHVFYSQELRPYALPALITAIGWWLVLQQKDQRGKYWAWKLGLVTALGLYSSYLYPFAALGHFAYPLWKKTSWKSLGIAAGTAVALFAPWVPFFLEQLRIGGALRTALPGWEVVVSTPQLQAIALVGAKFLYGVIPVDVLSWHTVVAVGLIISTAILWIKTRGESAVRHATMLLICWVILPTFTAWIVSFAVPVMQPKRLLFALPGLYVFLSILLTHQAAQRRLAQLVITTLIGLNLFGLYHYYTDSNLQREDWRSLHQSITADFPTETAVIMAFPEPFAPWVWYNSSGYPSFSSGTLLVNDPIQIQPVIKHLYDQYTHVLVFEYLQDLTDPDRLINHSIIEFGYRESMLYDGGPIGFVRVYSKPTAVLSYN